MQFFKQIFDNSEHFWTKIEKYYQHKYHTNFSHARKLFILDSFLVLIMLVCTVMGLIWYNYYDPSVVADIQLTVNTKTHSQAQKNQRIKSGEHITYIITYTNNSDSKLKQAKLRMSLPKYFQITSSSPNMKDNNTYLLNTIKKGGSGQVKLEGFYYGKPDSRDQLSAHLTYRQKHRDQREEKITKLLTILQGSYLDLTVSSSQKIVQNKPTNIRLTLKNEGHHDFDQVFLPLDTDSYSLSLAENKDNKYWRIDKLPANSRTSTTASIRLKNYQNHSQKIKFTPLIELEGRKIPQQPTLHTLNILKPELKADVSWSSQKPLTPGESRKLNITLANRGNSKLSNLEVTLPVSEYISTQRLAQLNRGSLQGDKFTISDKNYDNLSQLSQTKSTQLTLTIPISYYLSSNKTNIKLSQPIQAFGQANTTDTRISAKTQTNPIKVSSRLSLKAHARYYTKQGDQLGLGPLPPKVGETTRYWIFVTLANTTNKIQDITFSADLPSYVSWVGKSSVNEGSNLEFRPDTNQVIWGHNNIAPHSEVGLYWTVELTPTAGQINKTPTLVKDLSISARDNYTKQKLYDGIKEVDAKLEQDKRALRFGTKVQPN